MRKFRTGLLPFSSGVDGAGEALFAGLQPARRLRVLVDAELHERLTLETGIEAMTLIGLLSHERVDMSLYSEHGPPTDAERIQADEFAHGDEAIGWTTLASDGDDPTLGCLITKTTRQGITQSSVLQEEILLARTVLQNEGVSRDATEDARCIAAAQGSGADLFITERGAVLRTELEDRGSCRLVSPRAAIALVALYLRSAGQFYFLRGGIHSGIASGPSFYNRAAEHLVPSLSAFLHRGEGTVASPRLMTVQRRIRGLVESRDRLALLASGRATDQTADAVEATFSHALVDMVSLHDVLARVANELMANPEFRVQNIKWQTGWRERVIEEFPALKPAWDDCGPATELNRALRAIRNEIHDVAPIIAPYRTRWGAPQIGLGFLEGVTTKVERPLQRLEGNLDHGVSGRLSDGMVIAPMDFFEFIFPWMLRSVDGTLAALTVSLPERPPVSTDRGFKPEALTASLQLLLHVRTLQEREAA